MIAPYMAHAEIDFSGIDAMLNAFIADLKVAIYDSSDTIGQTAVRMMQEYIRNSSPSGKTYYINRAREISGGHLYISGKPTKRVEGMWRASAGGQPPAITPLEAFDLRSGKLINSFDYMVSPGSNYGTSITVYNYAEHEGWYYGYLMEYGTSSTFFGGGIEPRPFMEPVINSSRFNNALYNILASKCGVAAKKWERRVDRAMKATRERPGKWTKLKSIFTRFF